MHAPSHALKDRGRDEPELLCALAERCESCAHRRMDGIRALSELDVAQSGGRRIQRLLEFARGVILPRCLAFLQLRPIIVE